MIFQVFNAKRTFASIRIHLVARRYYLVKIRQTVVEAFQFSIEPKSTLRVDHAQLFGKIEKATNAQLSRHVPLCLRISYQPAVLRSITRFWLSRFSSARKCIKFLHGGSKWSSNNVGCCKCRVIGLWLWFYSRVAPQLRYSHNKFVRNP